MKIQENFALAMWFLYRWSIRGWRPRLINLSPTDALNQLSVPLAQSPYALIFITPLKFGAVMSTANHPGGCALPHFAKLWLQLKKEDWCHRVRDVRLSGPGAGVQEQARASRWLCKVVGSMMPLAQSGCRPTGQQKSRQSCRPNQGPV